MILQKRLKGYTETKATRWSYTGWSSALGCLFRYYCKFILKMPEPGGPALDRGIKIHKMQEDYLKGVTDKIPKELKLFKPHLIALRKMKPIVEQFWGVDKNWRPVNYNSWVVMKMDAGVLPSKKTDNRLILQDLKTGKEYDSHEDQASLYATIGGTRFEEAEGVDVEFWYSDSGKSYTFEFTRKMIKRLREYWMNEGRKVLAHKKFPPSPEVDRCRWCFLRSDKGGPCEAWKKVQ